MLRTIEIARQLIQAEKAGKKSIIVTHEKNSCVLSLEKVKSILKSNSHYSKKLWQAEIEKLGIMNICEQRLHRVCMLFGLMKGLPKLEAKQANANKMLCTSLQLHCKAKDLQASLTKKIAVKKDKITAIKKIGKKKVTTKTVKAIEPVTA